MRHVHISSRHQSEAQREEIAIWIMGPVAEHHSDRTGEWLGNLDLQCIHQRQLGEDL